MRHIKIILKSFADFYKDGGMMLAASISYFCMMSLIPFCLLLVALLGYLLSEYVELINFFSGKLMGMFPAITHEITDEIEKIILYKDIGKFSLLLYAFLAYQLFFSMESAINVVFKSKNHRSFIVSLALSLLIVTLILVFIIISFAMTSAISVLAAFQDIFPNIKISKLSAFIIGFIVPLFLVLLIVATLYTLLPIRKVKLSHAIYGALFTTILLEAAKHIFTFYIIKVVQMGTIYGSLSAFVIFLLWIFYSACIFLVGAELVHNMEGIKKRGKK